MPRIELSAALAVTLFLALGLSSNGCSSGNPSPTDSAGGGRSHYRVAGRLLSLRPSENRSAVTSRPVPFLSEVRTFDRRTHRVATLPAGESEIVWSVSPAPGSHLRFGVAVTADDTTPGTNLKVLFRNAGGSEQELWSDTRVAATGDIGVDTVELELGDSFGPGELVFISSQAGSGAVAGPDTGGGSVVSWSNPTILEPEDGPQERQNLIILCIDTLRADRLTPDVMPNLSERLRSAAWFTRAYANAPWSLPSIATIVTGLVPGEHLAGRRTHLGEADRQTNYNAEITAGGIELVIGGQRYRYQMLHESVPTVQETLGIQGYYTAAIHNNGYINYPTRVLKGTDEVLHYPERDAQVGTEHALDWLGANRDLDFYLFLHYIDPHQWPKRIPEELQGRTLGELAPDDRKTILRAYDEQCHYTDRWVERVFRELETLGLTDKTYVILVADHGERFFEEGVVGSHGGGFQESVIRIPLAVWGPGVAAGTYDVRVQLADVVPTALDLLEVRGSPEGRFGSSLEPVLNGQIAEDQTVVSEYVLWSRDHAAWIEGHRKLVWYPSAESILYDATGGGLRLPVLEDFDETARTLKRHYEAHRKDSEERFRDLNYEDTRMDEETLRSLKALGYIG